MALVAVYVMTRCLFFANLVIAHSVILHIKCTSQRDIIYIFIFMDCVDNGLCCDAVE